MRYKPCVHHKSGIEYLKVYKEKNYTNMPRPQEKSRSDDGQWKKIEASMNSVFGKPYLTEEDWMI